jgi:hypothetical protein
MDSGCGSRTGSDRRVRDWDRSAERGLHDLSLKDPDFGDAAKLIYFDIAVAPRPFTIKSARTHHYLVIIEGSPPGMVSACAGKRGRPARSVGVRVACHADLSIGRFDAAGESND